MPDQQFHKEDEAFRAGEELDKETKLRVEIERLAVETPIEVDTEMMMDALKTHALFTTYIAVGFNRAEALHLTAVLISKAK